METRHRELDPDLFRSADIDAHEGERIASPPVGFWKDAWRRLKKNRGALISLAILVAVFAMAFAIGPLLALHSPYEQSMSQRYLGPTTDYWFGTDKFGRDMWTRVWAGTRVSLYIGLLAALLDIFVGVVYGAVSGFLGGRVDDVLQRGIEILNDILFFIGPIVGRMVFT